MREPAPFDPEAPGPSEEGPAEAEDAEEQAPEPDRSFPGAEAPEPEPEAEQEPEADRGSEAAGEELPEPEDSSFPGAETTSEPEPESRRASLGDESFTHSRYRGRGQRDEVSWFLRVFVPVAVAVLGLVVAVFWILSGGWPRDHDEIATLKVPGSKTAKLDSGELRLYFQESGLGDGEGAEAPTGLSVEVISAAGGVEPLQVETVPSFTLSGQEDGVAHEPYGKVEISEPGAYRFVTSAEVASTAEVDTPQVTVGKSPWRPANSVALGALMIIGLFTLLGLIPRTVSRRRRERGERTRARAERRQRRGSPGVSPKPKRRSRRKAGPRDAEEREEARQARLAARMESDRARRGGSGALSPAIRSSGAESPSEGSESSEPARRGRR